MAQLIGSRSTGQAITETRLVRNIAEEIAYLEPNVAPLITFLNRLNKRVQVDSPRYEWFEDDFVARWASNVDAVANNAASTTVTVTDGTLFTVGDLFIVPQAVGSSTAPEMARVTTISTNTLTVVRNVGSAGLVTIAASGALCIVGNAFEEGGAIVSAKTTAPVAKITYTQIFRSFLENTRTQANSKQYGDAGGERKRQQGKKLKEHKIDLNRFLLFGRLSEGLTGGLTSKPIRTSMGLNSVVSTNVTDGGSVLSLKTFMGFSRQAFRYGSTRKLLLACPKLKEAISAWGTNHLQVKAGDQKFGVDIMTVDTPFGIWMVVNDWSLEDGVASQNGFGGTSFSVDMDELKFIYLKGSDTQFRKDIVKDGADRFVDEYLTEGGFVIRNEKYHAKLYNVVDYMS